MSTKTSPTSTKYKINFQVGARLEAMDYTLSWWVVLLSCTERFTCFWLVFLVGMFLKTARVTQILFVCMLGWFQPVLKNFRDFVDFWRWHFKTWPEYSVVFLLLSLPRYVFSLTKCFSGKDWKSVVSKFALILVPIMMSPHQVEIIANFYLLLFTFFTR